MLNIQHLPPGNLVANKRNARTHSKKQIGQIADSIKECGFVVPIVVDETSTIIMGHGRLAAAQLLGLKEIPVVVAEGLSEARRRALALADNRIAQSAGWDREILSRELEELKDLLVIEDLDISITGFEPAEIDQLAIDLEEDARDPGDDIDSDWLDAPPVTQPGDIWQLGPHRILCGDARNPEDLHRLMGDDRAAMAFTDPPYNVVINKVVGRGDIKHEEFAMGSGEFSRAEFVEFLTASLGAAAAVSTPGGLHFVCMDWRHLPELFAAGEKVYDELLNLVVWVKTNAGQGSFYRSRHEMIGVFRVGGAAHLNNVQLGRLGRSRSNVWEYRGMSGFGSERLAELKLHPTVKPVAMVSDAMRDCTRRGDVVLDSFAGSGTVLLAAERVGRRARALEIAPKFVDVAIRRWQNFTGKDAVLSETGVCFTDMVAKGQL
jgi:DNA modification methylase